LAKGAKPDAPPENTTAASRNEALAAISPHFSRVEGFLPHLCPVGWMGLIKNYQGV